MLRAHVRFYEELNDFLPAERRKLDIETESLTQRSVKDLIESLGVPHVEVDLILVNGESRSFDYLVSDGDRISVYPVFERFDISGLTRLRPEPLRTPRFVLDVHLKTLARKLRLLGFDVDYQANRDDADLADISRRDDRTLLTRDRGLLMRSIVRRGLYVRNTDPDAQVEEIVVRLDLQGLIRPFRRCARCNGLIRPVASDSTDADEVARLVPEGVRRWCGEFYRCEHCKHIYWKGSHFQRITEMIDRLRGSGRAQRTAGPQNPDL